MSGLKVSVVCRNWKEDRIIPRMARALSDRLGWSLGPSPDPTCDMVYLLAYFESQRLKTWPEVPVAAYLTHREEDPPGNSKQRLFDGIAERVQLRVVTCRMYADLVRGQGPTLQAAAPVERERFTLSKREQHARAVVGVSGYTYGNGRKGEALIRELLQTKIGGAVEWRASGRGWPVPTKRHSWAQMPGFYQGLDVLVVPSLVEGIPMPPLEALACGVSVVVPRHVGIIDELPEIDGVYRYECGDGESLALALEQAVSRRARVSPADLREATAQYSVEAWCEDHRRAFEELIQPQEGEAGIATTETGAALAEEQAMVRAAIHAEAPLERGTGSTRGIYCVAFGDPARTAALRMMQSAKKHMPDIPIALCAAKKIGPEDVLIIEPDSDVGGRRAKLKAYELAPAEWQAVLYLDADTEIVAPIYRFFEWIEDGWELVITKDPHLMDTMHSFERANNKPELAATERAVKTLNTLQWNGGVWAFGRNAQIAAFFARWRKEWEVYAQRDQGALVRAMYADPLRVLTLGNEWNTFNKYSRGITTAGLMHYPGDARRWDGLIPGRIDSAEAWRMVTEHERRGRGR